MWKNRGAGRCEGRDAGVSASLGDSTDRFFFVDFLSLALSYEKLEETGKEEEWEHGGAVRRTELASPQHCCCALFWTFTYGTYKERSLRFP